MPRPTKTSQSHPSHHALYTLVPPNQPVQGSISLPGSKSDSNRALIAAALTQGQSTLVSLSQSDDTRFLADALETIGVSIQKTTNAWHIVGPPRPYQGDLWVGSAGTTLRFLLALLGTTPNNDVLLHGTHQLTHRPIGPLIETLKQMGAHITCPEREGYPPVRVQTGPTPKTTHCVTLDSRLSSQFLTALLLAAPSSPNGLHIELTTPLSSASYIEMTRHTLARFGVQLEQPTPRSFRLHRTQQYHPTHYSVEGDASGASYLWGLAAITNGRVRVQNMGFSSPQGDAQFPRLLEQMGCHMTEGHEENQPWVEVQGSPQLTGIHAHMESMPDTAQTLAVLATIAEGTTHITGLHTLTHKETNRLHAVQTELTQLGAKCTATADTLTIIGKPNWIPSPQRPIRTYDDHRMAMAFSLLGSRFPNLPIEHPQVVSKSFPNYWEVLAKLGVHGTHSNKHKLSQPTPSKPETP